MPENASSSTRASMLESTLAVTLVVGAAAAASSYYWMFRKPHGHANNDDDKDESSPSSSQPPLSILEFEQEAKLRASPLAKLYVNYYDGQGLTGTANRQFLESIRLMPRILQGDLSEIDTELELFDYDDESESDGGNLNPNTPCTTLKLPVIIAPTSLHNLTCEDGEIATARACARSGAGYSYNWMLSSKSYLDVLKASASVSDPSADSHGNGMWLHLYMYEERDMVKESIRLAEATGAFSAIVLTCDHPHLRVQNRMLPSIADMLPKETADSDNNSMHDYFFPNQAAAGGSKATVRQVTAGEGNISSAGSNNPRLSWQSVKWIVSLTKLPVVVKGVLSPEDAVEAMRAGAAAIVVSNHGGRQFDGAPPAMEVLPAIVAKIKSRIPILVDSGIRSSTDIVKALCLGAAGVMLGRPALWALSCGGEDSLCRMLDHLRDDIADDMRSLGAGSIEDLDMSFLYAPDRARIERDIDVVLTYFDSDSD
jgi:isopentenyl diphosphate isomerase/L-lactate dehydrogenase-like FMN-dependent dehydrogenase